MQTIDVNNSIRPFALLKITNCLKRLQPGKELEILGLDVDTIRDLKRILPLQAHSIQMGIFSERQDRTVVRIRKSIDLKQD